MLFGELQRAGATLPKQAVQVLIGHYAARITDLLKRGVEAGEIDSAIDITTAAIQFIGSIQGLVIQSTLEGKPRRMRENAPAIFALYRRGIEARSGSAHQSLSRSSLRSPPSGSSPGKRGHPRTVPRCASTETWTSAKWISPSASRAGCWK